MIMESHASNSIEDELVCLLLHPRALDHQFLFSSLHIVSYETLVSWGDPESANTASSLSVISALTRLQTNTWAPRWLCACTPTCWILPSLPATQA